MKAEFERNENEETRVLSVRGDIDLDSSPALRDEIMAILKGARCVRIDLSGVNYIDSSGVATLIQGLKQAGRAGTDLALRDPSTRVLGVLQMAQLDKLFTIENTT